jgi:hypothetical protein
MIVGSENIEFSGLNLQSGKLQFPTNNQVDQNVICGFVLVSKSTLTSSGQNPNNLMFNNIGGNTFQANIYLTLYNKDGYKIFDNFNSAYCCIEGQSRYFRIKPSLLDLSKSYLLIPPGFSQNNADIVFPYSLITTWYFYGKRV